MFASFWSEPKEYPMNIQEKNETYVPQYALNELVQCDAFRSTVFEVKEDINIYLKKILVSCVNVEKIPISSHSTCLKS